MEGEHRFAIVRWKAGGALYDRLSGSTHLLDEIAILLLERGLSDMDCAFEFVSAYYPDEAPDIVRQHVRSTLEALHDASLI